MGYQATNEEYVPDTSEQIPADTIHPAKLLDVTVQPIQWKDKVTGDTKTADLLKWKWEITEGDYAGKWVWGSCDARLSTHPKNQFRNWSETLLGREVPPGLIIDTDDLLGLEAQITIKHRADKKDPAKVYVEVDEVLPGGDTGWSFDDQPPF